MTFLSASEPSQRATFFAINTPNQARRAATIRATGSPFRHSCSDQPGEVRPQSGVDVRRARRQIKHVRSVQFPQSLACIVRERELAPPGVDALAHLIGCERRQIQKAVRPLELTKGIPHTALVLQHKDLLPREVACPLAERPAVEPTRKGVSVHLAGECTPVPSMIRRARN